MKFEVIIFFFIFEFIIKKSEDSNIFNTLLLVNQKGAHKPLYSKKELAKERMDVLKPTNMCCFVIRL